MPGRVGGRGSATDDARRVIELLRVEPAKVGRSLGYKDLTDEIHGAWLKWFIFGEDSGLLLAHRGAYKTTCIALAIAFLCLLRPGLRIGFVRKTDGDVAEVLALVAKIGKHPIYRELGRRLWGVTVYPKKSTQTEFNLNIVQGMMGSSQVVGLGASTSITGKHFDILFYDDIVNKKDRVSRAEREHIKTLYHEFQNVVNRGGRMIGTGTPWHKEDAYSLIPEDKVFRYDWRRTGLISREKIMLLQDSMPPSLFAANYELKHIADTEALFRTDPKYIENERAIYQGIMHIDAAYSGNDGTAVTVLRKVGDNYIAWGQRWDKHVDDCIPYLRAIHKRFLCGSVHCEDNADKGYLKKDLKRAGLPAKGYHESTNKYIKIASYGLSAWAKTQWLDDTHIEYMSEILDYTEHAAHDDSPDSYASAVRVFSKGEVKANLIREGF